MWAFLFGKEEKAPLVNYATVKYTVQHTDFNNVKTDKVCYFVLMLSRDGERGCDFKTTVANALHTRAVDVMKASKDWLLYIEPWLQGTLTNEELAAALGSKIEFVPVKPQIL